MRRVVILVLAATSLVGGACSKSKLAEGATPTTPPLGGATVSTAAGGAITTSTAAADRPEVCKQSDDWGLFIIKMTDPTQRAGATPEELTAQLDQAAETLKAAVPEQADSIDVRTDVAKKKLAEQATEADTDADETAATALNVWYVATC